MEHSRVQRVSQKLSESLGGTSFQEAEKQIAGYKDPRVIISRFTYQFGIWILIIHCDLSQGGCFKKNNIYLIFLLCKNNIQILGHREKLFVKCQSWNFPESKSNAIAIIIAIIMQQVDIQTGRRNLTWNKQKPKALTPASHFPETMSLSSIWFKVYRNLQQ